MLCLHLWWSGVFEILYSWQFFFLFCCLLPCDSSPFVHGRCDIFNSHLIQIFTNATVKGIVKRAEPYKYDICHVSGILWLKRSTPSLKEWRLWHLIITGYFSQKFLLTSIHNAIPRKGCLFSSEKICDIECYKWLRSNFLWKAILLK